MFFNKNFVLRDFEQNFKRKVHGIFKMHRLRNICFEKNVFEVHYDTLFSLLNFKKCENTFSTKHIAIDNF